VVAAIDNAGGKAERARWTSSRTRIRDLRRTRAMSLERLPPAPTCRLAFSADRARTVLASLRCWRHRGRAGRASPGVRCQGGRRRAPDAIVTVAPAGRVEPVAHPAISKQLLSPAGSEGRLNLFWSIWSRRKHRRELYRMTARKPDVVIEGEMKPRSMPKAGRSSTATASASQAVARTVQQSFRYPSVVLG